MIPSENGNVATRLQGTKSARLDMAQMYSAVEARTSGGERKTQLPEHFSSKPKATSFKTITRYLTNSVGKDKRVAEVNKEELYKQAIADDMSRMSLHEWGKYMRQQRLMSESTYFMIVRPSSFFVVFCFLLCRSPCP